ncbi:hypothetical protein [Amphibacillus cookii]|nr:hypothetical protein [Amphibacillus cookii]MBM7543251.1 hypothetical protein [Amphibacillus cookii]
MISPGVMLVTGTAAVGIMLPIIIKAFKRSDKDLEKDERDFEYQEY